MAKRKRQGNETLIHVTREEMEQYLTEVCQTGIRSNTRRAFNETEVNDIRLRTLEGVSRKAIAKATGVSVATIGSVIKGEHAYWYKGDSPS